ncbi:MAG: phosphate ABC transporter substrate-binding protein, partial [Saprospiraceae bacterium]|nr:phosphate ABC transporter substrate-binding protein [Saprospiraceae bacterium]
MHRLSFFIWVLLLMQCKGRVVESISIKGSDTEVNLVLQLAEAYMATDPGVSLSITGGGSGTGIAALINGKTDIANSSREINQYERNLAIERGIVAEAHVFASDALAIITQYSVGIDSLTFDDLEKIFTGQISDWSALGGRPGPISLYGRQSNSGTFMYFRERVLGKDFSPQLKQMNGTAQILEAVKSDPGGIGYVGLGYLTTHDGQLREGIRVVRVSEKTGVAAISPLDKKMIFSGLYPLTRPLFHYVNGAPRGSIRAFFDFEKSEEGQRIIVA